MKTSSSGLPNRRMITGIYVFVLVYTVVQLLWWGVLLHQQSKQIAKNEQLALTHKIQELHHPAEFMQEMQRLHKEQQMRTFRGIEPAEECQLQASVLWGRCALDLP